MIIKGDGVKANVMTDDVEKDTIKQIKKMVESDAIRNDVVIQADCHPGAGSVIGFTMPLEDRIVPNIVGVDIGCGVLAFEIGETLPLDNETREEKIRNSIPTGNSVNNFEDSVHLENEFWWDETNELFQSFSDSYNSKFGESVSPPFEFNGYDEEYLDSLCERVLADSDANQSYIIKSVATLGGGNHFIEFAQSSKTGNYWCVIHSGSRYLGKAVAEYWQNKAVEYQKCKAMRAKFKDLLNENPHYQKYIKFDLEDTSNEDMLKWITGGMGESFVDYEKLKMDFEDNREMIETIGNRLKDCTSSRHRVDKELAWLNSPESHGYYVDMIFSQQYARFNRHKMMERICDFLETSPDEVVESTHNYIDFKDMIIRKGATPSRKGEKLIIPFNMSEGSLICRGKGNEDFLSTAPHGAGRQKSRRAAKDELSMDEFRESMDGIYSESVEQENLDEAPGAYKQTDKVISSIKKTADIIEKLEVVHNIKE